MNFTNEIRKKTSAQSYSVRKTHTIWCSGWCNAWREM